MELTVEILDQRLQSFEEKLEQKLSQKLSQKLEEKLSQKFGQIVDQKITEAKNEIIRWVVGLVFASMVIMIGIVTFYTASVTLITQ